MKPRYITKTLLSLFCLMLGVTIVNSIARAEDMASVAYRTVTIEDVDIFYR